MSTLAVYLAFSALSLVSADYQLTNHPVISPQFEWNSMTDALIQTLPNHTYQTDTWAAGYLPEYCQNEAQRNSLNEADFRVVNVTYDDCSADWVFCIYNNVTDSDETIFQAFGQVPVGMRSYIANMIALPSMLASPGAAAITNRYYTAVSDGYWNPGLLGHELSHALDFQVLGGSTVYWSDNSSTWHEAEGSDKAIPTTYGQTNWLEDFAEIGRLSLTNKNVQGGLAAVNANSGQISNQVQTYEQQLGSVIYPDGGKCVSKVPSSDPVDIRSGNARRGGRGRPEVRVPEGVRKLPLPEVWVDDIIVHYPHH